jgi:Helix-hairpin-helix motif
MFLKLFIICCLFISIDCYSQSDSTQTETDQTIEDLIEEPAEETDNSDLYELIEYYIEHPVDLNKASIEELSQLPRSDLSIAQIIISHRNKYGKFFSKNELYSIQSLDAEVVNKLLPFVSVKAKVENQFAEEQNSRVYISVRMRNRMIKDLQKRKGYIENKFAGSPLKIYNRIKAGYNDNIQLGFLTEKDAGETSLADFSSGFLNINDWKNFNNIIIGDYLVEFGQGLALWSPYGFSKSSDAIYSVKKRSHRIKPYSSATENQFFRGAAAEYNWEHISIDAFYSRNKLDANVDSSTGLILSTPLDGYHRTETELLKRKLAAETSYGISLNYSTDNPFSLGFLYYNSHFNHEYSSSDLFHINGDNFNYFSSYYNIYENNFNVFGEFVYDGTSVASYNGIKFAPTTSFVYSLSVRNYPHNYINLHGFGFGEKSGATQNEVGIYNGFRLRTSAGIINFYYDQFKFPYATFDNPLPSEGNEFMLNYSARPLKNIQTNLRFKLENKEVTETINFEDELVRRIKQSYRIEFIYNLVKNVRLKTRVEYSDFFIRNVNKEKGYLLFEDIRVEPNDYLLIYGRIVFFKTDSFNSAIYEYENDLTGILSSVGLYGEGTRLYFVCRYKFLQKFYLSVKYAETYKPKDKTLGSGNSEINGNIDNRVGLQLDFNL